MFNVSFYERCTDPEQSNRVYRNYANSSFTRRINWLFFNNELTNSHSLESYVQNQWLGVHVNKFVMFRGQAYPKLNIDMFITPCHTEFSQIVQFIRTFLKRAFI